MPKADDMPEDPTKCSDCGCLNGLHFPWCKHHGTFRLVVNLTSNGS